jgi:magnesium-transporting ATPase (P-type)
MVSSVDLNPVTGLSDRDAIANLDRDGYNELPSTQARSLLSIAWESIQDPIFLLLVGGGIIYWILGDLQEALILLGFVVFLTAISLYQEGKTEHALEALRDLSSPRALVIRDGKRKRIAGREVVRDDILMLAEGDRVPADAIVLSCTNLSTDESLLTGESLPVRKIAAVGNVEMAHPGGDELPFVYSGTLVVQGQGIVKVRSIGTQTEMGKIGNALQKVQPEVTPLQREMNRLVSRLFGIALSLCVAIVVIYGATTGDWLKGVLAGITLAMAILPNEFPVVVTIFLALGAWRISQNHVLARRTSAVETVGSATVLCVDKTGTLTLNQMAVQQLFAYNHPENSHLYDLGLHSQVPLPEAVHLIAIHIPIAGMSLIPVLFKLPLVLLPIHVAFLHLIIDPACSIVLEAEPAEANVMKRPPRNPKEPLFGKKTLGLAMLQGGEILVIILTVFAIATYRQQGELDVRALTFTTLIVANLGLILSEGSTSRLSLKILNSPNPALWWVISGGVFFMAIVLYVPFLRNLFSFSFLHPIDLAICLGGGLISLLWFELLKQTKKRNLR